MNFGLERGVLTEVVEFKLAVPIDESNHLIIDTKLAIVGQRKLNFFGRGPRDFDGSPDFHYSLPFESAQKNMPAIATAHKIAMMSRMLVVMWPHRPNKGLDTFFFQPPLCLL